MQDDAGLVALHGWARTLRACGLTPRFAVTLTEQGYNVELSVHGLEAGTPQGHGQGDDLVRACSDALGEVIADVDRIDALDAQREASDAR